MTGYLLLTGEIWQGVVLFACGVFVISTVDDILRPILIGRETGLPNYVVLIATFSGFQLMGFNGFVIGPVLAAMFIAAWEILADAQADGTTVEVKDSKSPVAAADDVRSIDCD